MNRSYFSVQFSPSAPVQLSRRLFLLAARSSLVFILSFSWRYPPSSVLSRPHRSENINQPLLRPPLAIFFFPSFWSGATSPYDLYFSFLPKIERLLLPETISFAPYSHDIPCSKLDFPFPFCPPVPKSLSYLSLSRDLY